MHSSPILILSKTEAEHLCQHQLPSPNAIQETAHTLLSKSVQSVLIDSEDLKPQAYWTNGKEAFWIGYTHLVPDFTHRLQTITACLELGYPIKDAIVIATMHEHQTLRLAKPLSLQHHWPEDQADLPYLSPAPLCTIPTAFKPCYPGLYPVVDSSEWIASLLPQGVTCIQLRIKNTSEAYLEDEIKRSVCLAKQYNATLFINDHWELAIQCGATGVHLGQDDLQTANIERIHRAGLLLGISTHGYYEVARAHALNPSYIACGPIYSTTSKIVSVKPQGINELQRWRRTLNYPLVAIGGITLERLPAILASGVDGVALISAITQAEDPLKATRQFLEQGW